MYHSVKESLDSLRLLDITCAVYTDDEGCVPSQALLDAYDFFEQITEREICSAKTLMVLIGAKNGEAHITINISGDGINDDEGCYAASFRGGDRHDL